MEEIKFNFRHIAHITIEAKTALKIGSNSIDAFQDSPIQKDWNGLPMILGTSLAGVLRKEFDTKIANDIFGDENTQSKTAKGSRVIFSNALVLNEEEKVTETLLLEKSNFLKNFKELPMRDHNSMDEKGVTKNGAKFDEEIIFKGSRFKFSIELISNEEKDDELKTILEQLFKNSFRIGAGSSKGYGQIEVFEIFYDTFDITSQKYADFSSSLNTTLKNLYKKDIFEDDNYIKYELKLTPDDFFMFGSGYADEQADMTPVVEKVINYDTKTLSENEILIPASSVKGAISHRTTYHYNLLKRQFIENGVKAQIVEAIFGAKKDNKEDSFKGNILISDLYLKDDYEKSTKVFDHVSIDRFTSGAIDGALFQEKTVASRENFTLEILLNKDKVKEKIEVLKKTYTLEEVEKELKIVEEAFEEALKDITTGMLPLGGATTKGHGVFTGVVLKDGKVLENGEKL